MKFLAKAALGISLILGSLISLPTLAKVELEPGSTGGSGGSSQTDVCHLMVDGKYYYSEEVRAAYGCTNDNPAIQTAEGAVTMIINGILATLGIVCVVFVLYGGIQYMTSAGDASKLTKAKHTILYSCIGLIICALAFSIANFVIGILNG